MRSLVGWCRRVLRARNDERLATAERKLIDSQAEARLREEREDAYGERMAIVETEVQHIRASTERIAAKLERMQRPTQGYRYFEIEVPNSWMVK